MTETAQTPLTPEDAKLVTLARATRARVGAAEGAAVRDTDGRTYAAASVELSALRLGAVQACVAMAIAGGSTGLEAVVRLGEETRLDADALAVLREFGGDEVLVHLGDPRGRVLDSRVAGAAY
ncbi:cytidine deaminase [Nocardioides sp. Y6]|uniref:Cytidine deaminase n=1 Tax=Nocardioides malaquae TaxID=2773426 RepID=A0ABR9RQ50_9ACTN|nr:cytidine deaminase [Nocardioides malaquae]MBE7323694.1 cytidine deaminase [Nocardioides malaquae]